MVKFECTCPVCEEKLNAATALTDDEFTVPGPGDVTICSVCHALIEFGENMETMHISVKDLEPEVQDIIVATLAYMQENMPQRTIH